jgi:DNA-directed RNA polymerase specialized sigma24 family protein
MADREAKVSDSDIALMMAMQDREGLRLLIERYGGRLKAFLFKRFRSVLQEGELAEALNVAFYNIWRFADRYDETKGSLPSWCIRIAQMAAQSIIRRESDYRSKNLEYDAVYDPAGNPPDEGAAEDHDDDPRIDALHKAIAGLPPLQKAIIQADLAADGLADAGRLAGIHGTSKNSIYVSRSKAREVLKRQVEQISRQPAGKRR